MGSHEILAQIFVYVCSVTQYVCQAPLFMEFSRQEYWSGLPFPSPGDLPNPEIKPVALAPLALASRFFISEPPGKLKETETEKPFA